MAIAEGQFNTIGNSNIKVGKKSGDNGELLEDVTMHVKSNQGLGNKTVIKSKRGVLKSDENSSILKLDLIDGYYYEDIHPKKYEEQSRLPFAKAFFEKYTINIDLSNLNQSEEEGEIVNTNTMLNISELDYTIDSLEATYKKDVQLFADNISQNVGFVLHKKSAISGKEFKGREDILNLFNPNEKARIIISLLEHVSPKLRSVETNDVTEHAFKPISINLS